MDNVSSPYFITDEKKSTVRKGEKGLTNRKEEKFDGSFVKTSLRFLRSRKKRRKERSKINEETLYIVK